MKQTRSHLAALLLAVAMLMTSAVYAAPSPERPGTPDDPQNPEEITIVDDDIPLVEVPSVEVRPQVTVENGTATVEVNTSELLSALKAVVSGEAARITVNAAEAAGASSVAAVLPVEALKAVAAQGGAEVQLTTSAGEVTLPSSALASIVEAAGGSDISIIMNTLPSAAGQALLSGKVDVDAARIQGGSVTEIIITSGGERIAAWSGDYAVVYLPVGDAAYYEENQSYTVYQTDASGNLTAHVGVCVMVNGELYIVVSVHSAGTFVVLPGSTGVSMAVNPTIVPSPLFQA